MRLLVAGILAAVLLVAGCWLSPPPAPEEEYILIDNDGQVTPLPRPLLPEEETDDDAASDH